MTNDYAHSKSNTVCDSLWCATAYVRACADTHRKGEREMKREQNLHRRKNFGFLLRLPRPVKKKTPTIKPVDKAL